MALRLIRRHLQDLPAHLHEVRRCKCPIHVYGTLAGERIRKALDQTYPLSNKSKAKAVRVTSPWWKPQDP